MSVLTSLLLSRGRYHTARTSLVLFGHSHVPLKHAALVILRTILAITLKHSVRHTRGRGPLAGSYSPWPYPSHHCVRT